MPVYRFKIAFEDSDDVSRDIEIKPSQNFEDLHHAIQQSINFDASQQPFFYLCNHNWRKEKEISGEKLKKPVSGYIDDPHQKFIYEFEPAWSLLVELFKIVPDESGAKYPRCIKSTGTAPPQYKPTNIPAPEDDEDEKEQVDDSGFYRDPDDFTAESADKEETEGMEEEGEGDADIDIAADEDFGPAEFGGEDEEKY